MDKTQEFFGYVNNKTKEFVQDLDYKFGFDENVLLDYIIKDVKQVILENLKDYQTNLLELENINVSKWYNEALKHENVISLLNDNQELDINDINILKDGTIKIMGIHIKGYRTISYAEWYNEKGLEII